MSIRATICEVIQDGKLLLQRKSVGKFGEEKWNGPGGKLESGETPWEGVTRELYEETGIKIKDPRLMGVLDFYFGRKSEPNWICYVFSTETFSGEPENLGEGELRWFRFKEIPYNEMWEDDKYWLPLILEGRNFRGIFFYDEGGENLLEHHLEVEP
jgi:8-oxo-dGTP diphosphatase